MEKIRTKNKVDSPRKKVRNGVYYWFEILLGVSIATISYYCMVWYYGFSTMEMVIFGFFHGFWAAMICYIIRFGKPPYHLLGAFLSSLIVGAVFHYHVFATTSKIQPVFQKLHSLEQQESVKLRINSKTLDPSGVNKFIKLAKFARPHSGTTSQAGLTHGKSFSLTIVLPNKIIAFYDCYCFKEPNAPNILFITSRRHSFPLYITFTIPNGRKWAKKYLN